MRLSKKMATAVGIAAALAVLAPGAAHADTGGAVVAVVGSGTIDPGLTATAASQEVEFSGTAAGAAFADSPVADAGAVNCEFSGRSGAVTLPDGSTVGDDTETSAEGTGTVTGECTGTGVGGNNVRATCTLDYVRAGPLVAIEGSCTVNGGGATIDTSTTGGVFVFVPVPGLPTTNYFLAGLASGAGLS